MLKEIFEPLFNTPFLCSINIIKSKVIFMKSLSDTITETFASRCNNSLSDVISKELNESNSELSKAKTYVNRTWVGNDIIIKFLLSDTEGENLKKHINNLSQKKRRTPPKVIRLTKSKIALVNDD